MQNLPAFSAAVRKSLIDHGWKCKDLAKATGYSIHYIYSVLNGGRCSDKLAEKIVDVLGIPKHFAT